MRFGYMQEPPDAVMRHVTVWHASLPLQCNATGVSVSRCSSSCELVIKVSADNVAWRRACSRAGKAFAPAACDGDVYLNQTLNLNLNSTLTLIPAGRQAAGRARPAVDAGGRP